MYLNKITSKIIAILKYIENLDIIPIKFLKKLSDSDLYEIRIRVGSNIYRIICFFHKQSVIMLLSGFQKKTLKTPKNEIEKAKKYKQDYLRRST